MNQGISILLVTAVTIILFIWLLYKRKWKFWLDDKGLHLQPLFWLLITLPLIISAILWLLISADYSLNLTKDGYNQFIEYAKLPLLILTLSPILGAFVINAHRSIQTAKQIEETEKKNKIDIYYTIKKNIIDELNDYKNIDFKFSLSAYDMWSKGYLKDNKFEMKVNTTYLNRIEEKIRELININNALENEKVKIIYDINNKKAPIYSKEIFIAINNLYVFFIESISEINLTPKNTNYYITIINWRVYNEIIENIENIIKKQEENKNFIESLSDEEIFSKLNELQYIIKDIEKENNKIEKEIIEVYSFIPLLHKFITDFLLILYPQINVNKFIPSLNK